MLEIVRDMVPVQVGLEPRIAVYSALSKAATVIVCDRRTGEREGMCVLPGRS